MKRLLVQSRGVHTDQDYSWTDAMAKCHVGPSANVVDFDRVKQAIDVSHPSLLVGRLSTNEVICYATRLSGRHKMFGGGFADVSILAVFKSEEERLARGLALALMGDGRKTEDNYPAWFDAETSDQIVRNVSGEHAYPGYSCAPEIVAVVRKLAEDHVPIGLEAPGEERFIEKFGAMACKRLIEWLKEYRVPDSAGRFVPVCVVARNLAANRVQQQGALFVVNRFGETRASPAQPSPAEPGAKRRSTPGWVVTLGSLAIGAALWLVLRAARALQRDHSHDSSERKGKRR